MQDIPKLFTALPEWGSCLVFVMILKKRFSHVITAGIMLVYLAVLCLLQHYIGVWPVAVWIPAMCMAVGVMYSSIMACCDVSWLDGGMCLVLAFMVAEFVASFEWQIFSFFTKAGKTLPGKEVLFMVIFYLLLFGMFWIYEKRFSPKNGKFEVSAKELAGCVLMTVAVFLLSNISYVYPNTPFSGEMGAGLFYIRTLVDFSGVLILMTQQQRFHENIIKRELDTMSMLMNRQYDQYQASKSNIDVLNRKYHDLKHQIGVIRMEEDARKKEEYLAEMESGLKLYEAQNHTGNLVLDTILTGKSMYCAQNQIHFTGVADGALLKFMNVMDVCSIFGNALDNAIESVEQIKDVDKRVIRVAVYSQNEFLMIRFDNYYEEKYSARKKEDGLFVTTKKEKEYHGFGLKSISASVEKYAGTMTIETEDGWFYLKILIPIQEQSAVR